MSHLAEKVALDWRITSNVEFHAISTMCGRAGSIALAIARTTKSDLVPHQAGQFFVRVQFAATVWQPTKFSACSTLIPAIESWAPRPAVQGRSSSLRIWGQFTYLHSDQAN